MPFTITYTSTIIETGTKQTRTETNTGLVGGTACRRGAERKRRENLQRRNVEDSWGAGAGALALQA